MAEETLMVGIAIAAEALAGVMGLKSTDRQAAGRGEGTGGR